MKKPVGNRHFAGQEKGYWPSEKPEQYKSTTEKLKHPGDPQKRQNRRLMCRCWKSKQLLRTMFNEERCCDNAQKTQCAWCPSDRKVFKTHWFLLSACSRIRKVRKVFSGAIKFSWIAQALRTLSLGLKEKDSIVSVTLDYLTKST